MLTFPHPLMQTYPGVFDAITAAGYGIENTAAGLVVSGPGTAAENEAAVQAIINGYNFLKEVKEARRVGIKRERTKRYYLLYTPEIVLQDELLELSHRDLFGNVVDMNLDLWASIKATAKAPNADWQKLLDIRGAAQTAISTINGYTLQSDVGAVLAVTVIWPA